MEGNSTPLRVLIVDDTITYRKILGDILSSFSGVEVIGKAPNGSLALKKMEQTPVDLVFLDVFMPEMDGLETLQVIQDKYPKVNVIMISAEAEEDVEIVMKALKIGALDFIAKPQGPNLSENIQLLTAELKKVIYLIKECPDSIHLRKQTRFPFLLTRPPFPFPSPSSAPTTLTSAPFPFPPSVKKLPSSQPISSIPSSALKVARPGTFGLVVIGVSTGGPNALNSVIPLLPSNLGCPVLLVQHMPKKFTATLAEHLQAQSSLKVREATDNEAITQNTVLIAPGGYHMVVKNNPSSPGSFVVRINEDPPVHSCRPSVDALMHSIAQNWERGGILALIMTGMGEDGAAGVAAMKMKGCYCLAQDEKTSVVYGMPKAVAERGLADEILPLDQIAGRITMLCQKK